MTTFNPSKQVYSAVMEYILSNATLAKTFKPQNITRYDMPTHNRFPHKQSIAPADLPELIVQMLGRTTNRQSTCGYIEIYNFQATITTDDWTLNQATIAHTLDEWLIASNNSIFWHNYQWQGEYAFMKCEVLPMQMANQSAQNRNLSGWMYAVFFNIQVSRPQGVLADGN